MRKIFFFIILLILTNCNNGSKLTIKNNHNINDTINLVNDIELEIKTLKEFYHIFYMDEDTLIINDSLKKKFISERILKRIDSLTESENLILDYDPFIKGQDYIGNVINKTLKIMPLKNKNQFRASFFLFGEENEKRTNIDFQLKKDVNGNFLIYSIINDDFLNFKN